MAIRFQTGKTSRFSLLSAGLLSLAVSTSPFATAADATAPVQGGTLNIGLGSDTPVIDPSITAYSVAALVARNVVDSLVGQAQDNRFTPGWLNAGKSATTIPAIPFTCAKT